MGTVEEGVQVKPTSLWMSSRMGLAIVGFLGFVNLYALRVNLSVAMVCMVNQTALQLQRIDLQTATNGHSHNVSYAVITDDKCVPQMQSANSTVLKEDGEFVWNKEIQGLALGSFFWGYCVTQVPGGWMAARFGGKRVFGWCMLIAALATLLMPVAARVNHIFLMVLRFIVGLGEGVVWPAMHGMWAYWAPPLERSKLIGFTFAGSQIGNVLAMPFSALLCEYGFDGGWPSVFYVFGGLGVLWFVGWMFFAYDRPSQHPRISESERAYIQDSLVGQVTEHEKLKVPWLAFLKSGPCWGILIAHTCANFGTYLFLTNIPTYMREILKFDIKSNGAISAIPYIGFWAVINISAVICDTLRTKKILSTTHCRKLFTTVGQAVPAVLAVITGFIDCTRAWAAVLALSIGVAFIGCLYGAGVMVNHADIAPKYASILFGISNTIATFPGFIAPMVVGKLTTTQSQSEWQTVFYITAAVYVVGIIGYLVLASGDLQPWARDEIADEVVMEKVTPSPEEGDKSLLPASKSSTDQDKSDSALLNDKNVKV